MSDALTAAGTPAPELRVIGVGFGRTGTSSLREALTRLGFGPCDHMEDNFLHPERFALWTEALRRKDAGEPIDWRPLLADYRAIVDWPGAYFWRELAAAHPQAKVILTVRDPARWWASIQATIFPFLEQLAVDGGPALPGEVILTRAFSGRQRERAHVLAVLAEHRRAVEARIAAERLLVFDVRAGWEPLCAFLGAPAPAETPFPHVNDTAAFQADAGLVAPATEWRFPV
jgi:hypothetical protein